MHHDQLGRGTNEDHLAANAAQHEPALGAASPSRQSRTFRLVADHSYALWSAVGWPQLKAVTGDTL